MGLTNDDDPYTGERYLDLDGRRTHRVIKVIAPTRWGSKLPVGLRRYVVEVMVNDDNPSTVGRHSTVTEHTLNYRYKHLR